LNLTHNLYNMSNLFDIQLEYLRIMEEIEDAGGELTDETLDRLNINRDELEEKLDNYRLAIVMKQSEIDALKTEAKRLLNKATAKENLIDRLKERMKDAVKLYGEPTKTGTIAVSTKFGKFTFIKSTVLRYLDEDTDFIHDPVLKDFTTAELKLTINSSVYDDLMATLAPYGKVTVVPKVDNKTITDALKAIANNTSIDALNLTSKVELAEGNGQIRMT